jgi:membrane protease YdiL (CAAX protease family)
VEEVFFRGALDSYLHYGVQGTRWISAVFVSVCWGLWHAPMVRPLSIQVILMLIAAQLVLESRPRNGL